jgi:hypothetical protein
MLLLPLQIIASKSRMSVKSRGLTLRTVKKTSDEWWKNHFNKREKELLERERKEANLKNKSERAAWAAMRTEAHAAENAKKAEEQRHLALLATKPKGLKPTGPKPTGSNWGPRPTSGISNGVKKAFLNLIDLAETDEDYTALKNFLKGYEGLVNESDEKGITALMIASDNNNIKLVKLLIDNGANVNRLDKEGRGAFFYAKHSEDGEDSEDSKAIQKLLKENGLRPSSSNLSRGGARTRRARKSKGTRRR